MMCTATKQGRCLMLLLFVFINSSISPVESDATEYALNDNVLSNDTAPLSSSNISSSTTQMMCQNYKVGLQNSYDRCVNKFNCHWLDNAREQVTKNRTGRCAPCTTQLSMEACVGTGVCYYMAGRTVLGGRDCTLCEGRTKDDCKSTGYCFWNNNYCTSCSGYLKADECAAAGCFWRTYQDKAVCEMCGGYYSKKDCQMAGCNWNESKPVPCRENFYLQVNPETDAQEEPVSLVDGNANSSSGFSSFKLRLQSVMTAIAGVGAVVAHIMF